jgi:hypothetical protein
MEQEIKDRIIAEYLSGKGSTTIEKELKIYKPGILKVLNDAGILRKRDRCKSLNIIKDGDRFYVIRKCPKCGNDIKVSSKYKIIACRNYFTFSNNKSLCKPCSLKLQVGEGNPFYGKKHSKESLMKMTKTLTDNPRKYNPSSKPERKIQKIIEQLNFETNRTYRVKEYICDIFIEKLNLIIEFNGDYWHCNPNKYHPDYFHPHKKKTSKQIWDEDIIRIDNIKKYGYNLEIIWETDFIQNPNIIENIIKKYVKN